MPTALSAVAPSVTAALIGFVCPQQHRLRRAEVAGVGSLVAPHHYPSQNISAIGIAHQQGASRALFAGFRSRDVSTAIPSPSWALSVAEVAAPWCLIVRLILACSAVQRSYAALRRTRTPQGASVRLFLTHACCSPMLCCRIQA